MLRRLICKHTQGHHKAAIIAYGAAAYLLASAAEVGCELGRGHVKSQTGGAEAANHQCPSSFQPGFRYTHIEDSIEQTALEQTCPRVRLRTFEHLPAAQE